MHEVVYSAEKGAVTAVKDYSCDIFHYVIVMVLDGTDVLPFKVLVIRPTLKKYEEAIFGKIPFHMWKKYFRLHKKII